MNLQLYTYATVSVAPPTRKLSKLIPILQPHRDPAVENDIIVHEVTHGITNRLTGGGTGRCLHVVGLEPAGLGEGWSDAFADWTEQRGPTIKDFTAGT